MSRFRVLDNLEGTDDEIIAEFIRNKIVIIESVPEHSKDRDREGSSVFKYPLLQLSHFKKMTKIELYHFFANYLIERKWPYYEIDDLETTVAWLKKDFNKCNAEIFFVLSKDWFNKTDEVINQFEYGIYGYFFTVIYIDRENSIISSCLLIAD